MQSIFDLNTAFSESSIMNNFQSLLTTFVESDDYEELY